jgi:putative ABC transport system permease protein
VRTALGASRLRIVGQMFVEGLALSAIAAAVGLLIASIVRRQLDLLIIQAPFWADATLTSGPVIRNVVALAVLGAVIVGVVPALQVTGRRARTGLQHAAAVTSR